MSDQSEEPDRGGRPECLDVAMRRRIIALLANGSSRRTAARFVGCAHSTITRTAQRDPKFAADLDAAEHSLEIEALRNIRRAASKDRNWRAAAWLLERKNPHDFAPPDPTVVSPEQIITMFLELLSPWIDCIPDEMYAEFLDYLDDVVDLANKQPKVIERLKLLDECTPRPRPRHMSAAEEAGYAPADAYVGESPDDDLLDDEDET